MPHVSRRGVLAGTIGAGAILGLSSCSTNSKSRPSALSDIEARESALTWSGKIKKFDLTARLAEVDLGGRIAKTWIYGDSLPGKVIRVNKSDRVRVAFSNDLPTATSVHWHGLAIRNDMDGVPGVTSPEIPSGAGFIFDFITPDAGTYWFHPHSGIQLDRGLYAPFIVEDPNENLKYEREWIVVLDDWTDGIGKNPDQIFNELKQGNATSSGMGDMGGMSGMGDMGGMSGMGGMDSGDVTYPLYLVNGRPINDPEVFSAKSGEQIRLRIINSAADTIFQVALAGHMMTVTHTDGFPVEAYQTQLLRIGMGERYDLMITAKDGVFPLVAEPVGKSDITRALLRTGSGSIPEESYRPAELNSHPLTAEMLTASEEVRLAKSSPDRIQNLALSGRMQPYEWKINGRTYAQTKPLSIKSNEKGRLRIRNATMMPHPIHLHGHTFQLGVAGGSGARKDTVLVPSMGRIDVDLVADNPGKWMIHCHNAYHAEAGMMTRLEYIM
ncbi:MAG: multicopper oxidase family protein [Actinobacteria bacterium]|nr:multicopper oxidase family protein [Actinomycetota bacterium]